MKKFNFLVAFMMLTLFLSFESVAQELVPASKALSLVIDQVETIKKNQTAVATNTLQAPREVLVNNLKVVVGESMYEDLKSGVDTNSALTKSIAKYSSNIAERQRIVSEVDAFYRNLLRKPF